MPMGRLEVRGETRSSKIGKSFGVDNGGFVGEGGALILQISTLLRSMRLAPPKLWLRIFRRQ